MTQKSSSKKITRVGGDESQKPSNKNTIKGFMPTAESKNKATKFRLISAVAWVIAIALEIWAIILLKKTPTPMTMLIVLIIADLMFAVTGSLIWKKANRLDPASEQDKVRFFIQNQLGLIISIIAFLPLVILIFTSKNLDGKQKGVVGSIAVVAMLIAGITGIDFNPPSQEEYAAQTEQVESLNQGSNYVYWTKSGKKFHIYPDCQHINTYRTDEIFEGTVAQAREHKSITSLCATCEKRAIKENEALEQSANTDEIEE